MAESAFDVIVVGGGVAGLTAAALAARSGLRPLVCEQAEVLGGVCAPVERNGYRFDGCVAVLSGLEQGGDARTVLEAAGATVEDLPLDPGFQAGLPRHRFGFYRRGERFWREIRREFGAEEDAIRAFFEEVLALEDGLRRLDLAGADLPIRTAWGKLDRWFRRSKEEAALQERAGGPLASLATWELLSEDARGAFALVLRHLGPALVGAPVLLGAHILAQARGGFQGLRGGSGALVIALTRALERGGGSLRSKTRVVEILLRGRRVCGVRLADGSVVEAPVVIGAAPPATLSGELLADGARGLPEGSPPPQSGRLTLYVGVDEAVLPSELAATAFIALPDPLEPGGIDSLALSVSPFWDGGRAPQGRRALTLDAMVRPTGLDAAAVDWMERADGVLGALDHFIPGLRGRLDFCEVRTPVAWQELTGRPSGATAYAPEAVPVFLGWQGFPHRTPLPWLFVAGDWTFPGSSMAAVLQGAQRTVDLLAGGRP